MAGLPIKQLFTFLLACNFRDTPSHLDKTPASCSQSLPSLLSSSLHTLSNDGNSAHEQHETKMPPDHGKDRS